MFRHHETDRTSKDNLKLAAFLSSVAGSVNAIGLLSIHKFTTNVTGHFAYFVSDLLNLEIRASIIFFLYVFSFFFGAFVSSTLVEFANLKFPRQVYIAPVFAEILILILVGIIGDKFSLTHPDLIAILLLFAMGLQNALVTKISNAIVRTTHLTGLFTDLGIEYSQWFFYRSKEQRNKLLSNIILRKVIVTFFFIGGVFGGLLFAKIKFHSLFIPAILLSIGLINDNVKSYFRK
jgi:uncharacterized membrane protein YoaK (UPF0700 family)